LSPFCALFSWRPFFWAQVRIFGTVFKKKPSFGPFFVRSPVLCPFFTESPLSVPDLGVASVV
jgi:hypothetical protein